MNGPNKTKFGRSFALLQELLDYADNHHLRDLREQQLLNELTDLRFDVNAKFYSPFLETFLQKVTTVETDLAKSLEDHEKIRLLKTAISHVPKFSGEIIDINRSYKRTGAAPTFMDYHRELLESAGTWDATTRAAEKISGSGRKLQYTDTSPPGGTPP